MESQSGNRQNQDTSVEATGCLPITSNDKEQCPAPQPQDPHEFNDNRDPDSGLSPPKSREDTVSDGTGMSSSKLGNSASIDSGGDAMRQTEGTLNVSTSHTSLDPQYQNSSAGERHSVRGIPPLPPASGRTPTLSDTVPPGQKSTWHGAPVHNASLTGRFGFQEQVLTGQKLVCAMSEYVGAVKQRLGNPQQHLQRPPVPAATMHHGAPRDTKTRLNQAEYGGEATLTPANLFKEVLLETRFYNSNNGFDFMGGGERSNSNTSECYNITHNNHYTSPLNPNYLIRVKFEWKEIATSRPTSVTGSVPDSKDINVLSFMISSRPLTVFFQRRLNLDQKSDFPILKLAKPFRSVISNYGRLKDQLHVLTSRYGSVTAGHDIDCPKHSSHCRSSSQQEVSSAPPDSEGERKLELFDQRNALEHFRLLAQFIDQYLGDKIALFESYQTGRAEMVSYEDLWMLFSTGENICCPLRETRMRTSTSGDPELVLDDDSTKRSRFTENQHVTRRRYLPQAYRVMAVSGGSPRIPFRNLKPIEAVRDTPIDGPFSQPLSSTRPASQPQSAALEQRREGQGFSPLYVHGVYVDFDGFKYGPLAEVFVFNPFDGQIHIESLEAYPLKYFAGPHSNNLVQRGRKFIDVTASLRHMDHVGMTVGETKQECNSPTLIDLKLAFTEYHQIFPRGDSVVPRFESWPKLRVRASHHNDVLDFFRHLDASGCLQNPYCYNRNCGVDGYNHNQYDQQERVWLGVRLGLETLGSLPRNDRESNRFQKFMEDEDLLKLLPGSVPGFALRNRTWVQLDLNQLDYVKRQDDWSKLALPKGHRKIVQAMVEMHTAGSRNSRLKATNDSLEMDLVRGKGNGCIILLHGVPGVGKTSTAECVASYTKRPLYSITCGDVGYEPEDVERNMQKHFKLANRWGCVLLLDEADVFLARRDKTDVKRNGLVSVFLRILEYYSGILFLTTNRVGAIDDAFRSRLHLTLYYPKLTKARTLKIWKTNFQRLKENNRLRVEGEGFPIEFNDKRILSWVNNHWQDIQWNGRQIRNAFQSAVALAEFEAEQRDTEGADGSSKKSPVLTRDHFRELARLSTEFSGYLRETHGDDEDERAVLEKTRAMPTRRKNDTKLFNDDEDEEDEEDIDISDTESGKDSSGATSPEGVFDSGRESSDEDEKSRRKGKKAEGSRSHGSKRDRKGKRREDRYR